MTNSDENDIFLAQTFYDINKKTGEISSHHLLRLR